jgi:transcriptional regulator with XRE-family HTH domain
MLIWRAYEKVFMSTQIGKVFSQIVKERRLTLKEISKGTGVPATTLAEWQAGRTPKNPAQVRAAAKFLDVSLHFLLFGEEDHQEPISKIIREDVFQGVFEITVKRVKHEKG